MALSIPGLTAEILAKVKSGDLGALETLFRSVYPLLIAKAKEVLDDDGAAARVVERIFPKLFAERGALTTPQALGDLLETTVHDAAVRERSRLAGIRKRDDTTRKSVHVDSMEDAWAKIKGVIEGPTEAAMAEASAMKDKLAHEAAGHIKDMTKTTPMWKSALTGIALLAVVGVALFMFAKSGEKGRLYRQISAAVKDLKTGTGQRGNVTLDDGTKASFGADTRVILPEGFVEKGRGVGIEGVAEFTPATDAKFPFVVLAGKTGAMVTGPTVLVTAPGSPTFAVRHYKEDDVVLVRVKEGTVELQVEDPVASTRTLNTGQVVQIANDGSVSDPPEALVKEAFGYLDGNFVIENRSLAKTLEAVKRWYATDIFLKDTTLGQRMVTVSTPLESTSGMIKAIEAATGLTQGWEGQTMILEDKPLPKKK